MFPMHTGRHQLERGRRHDDRGFTLVELLIVIVILGILATVTVFAVRGITDQGQDNAEAADLRTLETAVESYYALNQQNPADQATLVTAGPLQEESSLHSYTNNGDGTYTITSNSGGGGGAGGGAAVNTSAGLPIADRYGTVGAANVHVIFGGPRARANWDTAIADDPALPADTEVYFVNITEVTTTDQVDAIAAGGAIEFAVWRAEDNFDFGEADLEQTLDVAILNLDNSDDLSRGLGDFTDVSWFLAGL